MDRRLLAGLEKPVWDSVALALQPRISDEVIDSAVARTPSEFAALVPSFRAKLRHRRDGMAAIADKFYAELSRVVDIHATNAADVASIVYGEGGIVDVGLRSGNVSYFRRRFDPRETNEVRVYLHDGDDSATVTGTATSRIVVRVVGGNGSNALTDATTLGIARMYDAGHVSGVSYGPDSLQDTLFNRRPWVRDTGAFRPPSTRLTV